jgi:hypothetical protein
MELTETVANGEETEGIEVWWRAALALRLRCEASVGIRLAAAACCCSMLMESCFLGPPLTAGLGLFFTRLG